MIVDDRRRLIDHGQNHTLGWCYGRLSKKASKTVVRDFIKRRFGIRVQPADVEIVRYSEANKMLFKLKNK